MTPERWAAAQALFEAALDVAPEARGAFVDGRAADADLAALVRGMLAADEVERSGDALADVVSRAVEDVTAERTTPAIERLGPYRVVSMLGEGGMGAVYLAERDDDEFLQRVAIKVVRGLLDSERVRQFRAERQILAWLEHPNIARLLDGGTTDAGLPYLVMEHVEGVPIDRHCDAHRLTVAERLRLFLEVCDAVSHAHRSLIVHRDIKPTNILVTEEGVPKLLDFGIARLALEGAGAETGLSRAQGRMLTPDYASPELVRGGQVTTAADVYALGVLLYELTTGRRPLRFATMSTVEIERVVCQMEPLPASSAASSESEPPTEPLAARLAARRTTAAHLRRALAGDLDAVMARAMAKDPADRYASVDALASDVRNVLAGRPVAARPATWLYTAGRFVSRHRWPVAAAAAFLLTISGAAVVLSVQAARLAEERDRTARERDTAQQVVGFLAGLFEVSNPDTSAGATVTARELLDRGAERIDAELGGQPVVQARLLGTMGNVYGSLGLYDRSARLLERSLDLRRSTLGAEHPDTAQSMQALADAYRELARYDEAERLHREALALKRRIGDTPGSIAASLNDLGLTLSERGAYDESEPLLREAVQIWRETPDAAANLAIGLNNLAITLRQLGRLDEAATMLEEAIAIRRRLFGNDHPLLAHVLGHLGQVRNAQGDLAAAEPLLREALAIRRKAYGDDHPDTGAAFNNLASLLHDAGDLAAAEPYYRMALATTEKRLGTRHPDYAVQLNNLASLLEDGGRVADAAALFRTALEIRRAALGDGHPAVARARHNLARVELALGHVAEAESLIDEALAVRRRTLPAGHEEIAASLGLLGELRAVQGRTGDAERLLDEALAMERQGARHFRVAATLLKLSALQLGAGRAAEAERTAREALAIRAERLPARHWERAMATAALGEALLALGRVDEARPLLDDAAATLARTLGAEDPRAVRAQSVAARTRATRAAR